MSSTFSASANRPHGLGPVGAAAYGGSGGIAIPFSKAGRLLGTSRRGGGVREGAGAPEIRETLVTDTVFMRSHSMFGLGPGFPGGDLSAVSLPHGSPSLPVSTRGQSLRWSAVSSGSADPSRGGSRPAPKRALCAVCCGGGHGTLLEEEGAFPLTLTVAAGDVI